jgi:hypothetical protein
MYSVMQIFGSICRRVVKVKYTITRLASGMKNPVAKCKNAGQKREENVKAW